MVLAPVLAHAAQVHEYHLELKDHRFIPSELEIPAGKKVRLLITNHDDELAEFESDELRREKIIIPHQQIKISIGPLEPGEYHFFDEFHEDTAQGKIIVR